MSIVADVKLHADVCSHWSSAYCKYIVCLEDSKRVELALEVEKNQERRNETTCGYGVTIVHACAMESSTSPSQRIRSVGMHKTYIVLMTVALAVFRTQAQQLPSRR
jgi:hypothetical protein